MNHVAATDKTKLYLEDWGKHGAPVGYDGAPHGVFATREPRLTEDLIDFPGR